MSMIIFTKAAVGGVVEGKIALWHGKICVVEECEDNPAYSDVLYTVGHGDSSEVLLTTLKHTVEEIVEALNKTSVF